MGEEAKISELNSIVEKKDEEITTLNKNIADLTTALETIKGEQESYWAERDAIERELGELKAAKRIAELNDALAQFTEEETKVAEENICKFKDDPINSGIEINSIVEAIKVNCYDVQKKAEIEAKEIAEINSKKDKGIEVDSIFGGMDVPADVDTNAINMDNLFA